LRSVAHDLATHTQAQITITGRNPASEKQVSSQLGPQVQFLVWIWLTRRVFECDHQLQPGDPLCWSISTTTAMPKTKTCIEQGANYVSDHPSFTLKALECRKMQQKLESLQSLTLAFSRHF